MALGYVRPQFEKLSTLLFARIEKSKINRSSKMGDEGVHSLSGHWLAGKRTRPSTREVSLLVNLSLGL